MSRRERLFEKLRESGADPKRSLGQNFLVSDMVVDRILMAVRSEKFSEMIEVGPGLGALTDDLLPLAAKAEVPMTLIELDRKFAENWRKTAEASTQKIRLIEADALQVDWRELGLSENTLFVSNLPYQISSSLVIERSIEPAGVTRMVLMFQKEVAQRIAARHSTEHYGLLTVIAQTFWDVSTVCDAGPRDFHPPPRVASRVVMFKRKPADWVNEQGASRAGFLKFAKAAYSHRRKLLLRNLEGQFLGSDPDATAHLAQIFKDMGLAPTARAEELDPGTFVRLYLSVAGYLAAR